LPSGHATEAFLVATWLRRLVPSANPENTAEQLRLQAGRIATNRVIAGVHFPVDSVAGRLLGETLAEYLIARCADNPTFAHRRFSGPLHAPDEDFNVSETAQPAFQTISPKLKTMPSPLLKWLWDKAEAEWL
jgi:hypothetical protein